jgi:hypothetical protein
MSTTNKNSVQGTEVIRENKEIRVTALKLSPEAKRGLSTDGARISVEQGLSAIVECLALAEEIADAALARQSDLGGLSAMFLARASQSLYSVGLLCQHGLIGDAMSVGRTVIEMTIDYGYIALSPPKRIPMFSDYDHISKFKLAKAIDKHVGPASTSAMRVLQKRHDTARLNNPDSDVNWAGLSLRRRAEAIKEKQFVQLYDLVYVDMCAATHSGYGTLEYALVDLDTPNPSIRFGRMTPNMKPIDLTFAAMVLLMVNVVSSCSLDKSLDSRTRTLHERAVSHYSGNQAAK